MYSFGQKCSNVFRPRAGIEVIWRATKACSICGVFDKVRKTRMEKKKKKISNSECHRKKYELYGCVHMQNGHSQIAHTQFVLAF